MYICCLWKYIEMTAYIYTIWLFVLMINTALLIRCEYSDVSSPLMHGSQIPSKTGVSWRPYTQIARFMRPTWGPPGADRTQVGPMRASWTLLWGFRFLYGRFVTFIVKMEKINKLLRKKTCQIIWIYAVISMYFQRQQIFIHNNLVSLVKDLLAL